MRLTSRILQVVGATLFLFVFSSPALAQMSFSTYSDGIPSEDILTIYGIYNAADYSSGCSHYSYQSGVYISSPTRYASSEVFEGLGAGVALQFEDEEGDWSMSGGTQFYCSCAGPLSVGSSAAVGFRLRDTFKTSCYTNPADNKVYCTAFACLPGSYPTCTGGALGVFLGTPTFVWSEFLVGTRSGGGTACYLGVSWATSGYGWCT
jgi:hypothetical protein